MSFTLKSIALKALVNQELEQNPDINNETMTVAQMSQSNNLKWWPNGTFESELKDVMMTAGSMIKNEILVLHSRFDGVLKRQPSHPTCPCHKFVNTLNLVEKIPVEPGKLATVLIRIHSAYPYNITEMNLKAYGAVLPPELMIGIFNRILEEQDFEAEMVFADAKCIQWFKRPQTSYGWKLEFLNDWEINKLEYAKQTAQDEDDNLWKLALYWEKCFNKVKKIIINDDIKDEMKGEVKDGNEGEVNEVITNDAIKTQGIVKSKKKQQDSNHFNWFTCPCGYAENMHFLVEDPVVDICTEPHPGL